MSSSSKKSTARLQRPDIFEIHGEDARACPYCAGACILKNIGHVCWRCIYATPFYIPSRQIEWYRRKILDKKFKDEMENFYRQRKSNECIK